MDKTANTTRTALLLAEQWDERDPAGWWLSEKLDGVRAYWDGRRFLSRRGNVFHVPDWFTADLPDTALDGELWMGRGSFQATLSIVRSNDAGKRWSGLCFVVFDAPTAPGPFEARMDFLREMFAEDKRYARLLDHTVCRGRGHMAAELARVEALGGEGLMLRKPGSAYEARRSETLLKVKTFHDAEASVIGHKPGKGKYSGRTGALLVRTADGRQFAVGSGLSDAQRLSPPPVGVVITYQYQELTDSGRPRFPSFLRVRSDAEIGRRVRPGDWMIR